MSIRKRLLLLVFAVWLPAAVGFGMLTWNTHQEQLAGTRRQVQEYGLRVATTMERELDRRVVLAQALASSSDARRGDFMRFHEEARSATAGADSWALLVDTGAQILNTKAPYPAPPVARVKPLPLAETGPQTVFVAHAPVAKTPAITVFVPVPGMAPQHYNVGVAFQPSVLQQTLDASPGPFKALTAVVDSEQRIMARSRDPEKWFGMSASPAFKQRILSGGTGFAESTTLDGVRSMTYLSPPNAYGWSVTVSVPMSALDAAAQQASAKAVGAAAALLAFGFILAMAGMRRIGRTVDALQGAARELAHNRVPPRLRTGVLEVDQVGAALHEAGVKAQQSNATLERRVGEAVAHAQDAQAKLLQSQKLELVGRLTAGVAHDFNNLLQTIVTAHHLLLRRVTDGPERRTLDGAVRAVAKARDLVKQLMTFGRVQLLEPSAVSIEDVVLKSQELTRTAVGEAIVLETALAPALPAVHVDPVQFEMALLNLVFNARDAMPAGGRIGIAAQEAQAAETAHLGPGRFVRVEVADTGTGMSDEIQARAFEPYFTTKPVGSGSGIGLAQVHAFARQSGGDTVLASALGVGTRIRMYLPVATAQAGTVAAPALPAPAPASPMAGVRILMVEDDQLVSAMVAAALEEEGCAVRHCGTADEALLVLQGGSAFDILFTDVVMPGRMNGIDLARWCAARRPGIAIVVSTGYAENLQEFQATVLRKPYETGALFAALEEACQRRAVAA
ncbi:ATP-binding protein [Pseudorhodoferax sp. Leaf274]|uniref:ATP-binding protein n=1 Tax=Pseudorhodoferax sp. Leaf274 TaxID=1736318 RepID=UPI001F42CD32|nr:ATP-binding protein [Pseudorhodoferax sp. Leaf274]